MRKDGEEDGRVTSQDQDGGKKVGKNDKHRSQREKLPK